MLAEAGREDRAFRAAVLAASVAPDIDGLTVLFGTGPYDRLHHLLSHNALFSLVVSALAVLLCRRSRVKVFLFTQVAFYLHYFGDYFFTKYPLYWLYPFSDRPFYTEHSVWVGHPVNQVLNVVILALVGVMAWRTGRSPLEVLSPNLDRRLVNYLLRKKSEACHLCASTTNERCETCRRPACKRHFSLTRDFAVLCAECRAKS
jgi:membrane-bound metal-dependent hydrolase YbcI (DUF457 family)